MTNPKPSLKAPQPSQWILTPREWAILELVSLGLSNRAIGKRLNLCEQTVKNRVSVILSKLELPNRTQAALWAKSHGADGDSANP